MQLRVADRLDIFSVNQHVKQRDYLKVTDILPAIAGVEPDGFPRQSLANFLRKPGYLVAVALVERVAAAERYSAYVIRGELLEKLLLRGFVKRYAAIDVPRNGIVTAPAAVPSMAYSPTLPRART